MSNEYIDNAVVKAKEVFEVAVKKTEGGAYSTMKYAAAQGVNIINLYDDLEERDR